MPRPRTPTQLLELRGAFVKNPHLRDGRENEPRDLPGLGLPPGYFNAAQRVCWGEIERTVPAGVLTSADGFIVEMAAVLLEKMRRTADFMKPNEFARLESVLGRLGLTPADRSKVSVSPRKPQNEFTKNLTRYPRPADEPAGENEQ